LPKIQVTDATQIAQPTSMQKHSFHLLDALRGMAAILVVTFHAPAQMQYLLNFPNSFLAVDFFFCLSGFVIAFSYENRLGRLLTLRDFIIIRVIRLYPIYLLSILIATVRALSGSHLIHHLHPLSSVVALAAMSLLLIPNLFQQAPDAQLFPLNTPAWSLFLELVANVAYGCIFLWRSARVGLPLVCMASFGVLTFLAFNGSTLDNGTKGDGLAFGFARVGFSFTAGILLFRIFNRSAHRLTGYQSLLGVAVTISLLLAALMVSGSWSRSSLFQLFVITVLFPSLVYLGASCIVPHRTADLCAFLGDMSYPLYILHVPLLLPSLDFASLVGLKQHQAIWPYVLPIYIVLLVLVSWWIGRYIDLPVRSRLTSAFKSYLASHVRTT